MQNQEKEKQMDHSREFKFRAWNSVNKLWLREDDVAKVIAGKLLHGFNNTPSDYLVVSEWTGLLDKNSKEIYESDIILHAQYGDWDKVDTEVEKIIISIPDFFKDIGYETRELGHSFDSKNLEIIGNIYEHPHLLTPENNK